jgi:hypothetical protein
MTAYNRALLISILAIHRAVVRPGLPIGSRCFCGWSSAGDEGFADHVATRYEQAALSAETKALRPLSLSAPR